WREHVPEKEGDLKPSDKVRERFLDALEDQPEYADSIVDLLPDSPSTHDRLYKLLQEEPGEQETGWKYSPHNWMKHHSRYFRDELVNSVGSAEADLGEADRSLRSLARLNWDEARPLIESLSTASRSDLKVTALILLYEHACQNGDSAEAG